MAADPSEDLFRGCDDAEVLTRRPSATRERIYSAANKQDPVSQRVFKSFSMDQANAVQADEFDELCWSRLDGVWREQLRVSFDQSVVASGWGAQTPSMLEFAHGTYTSPRYMVVAPADDYTHELTLGSGLEATTAHQFVSRDGIRVADVLKGTVPSKRYRGIDADGREMQVVLDVTRTGYVRLRIGDRI